MRYILIFLFLFSLVVVVSAKEQPKTLNLMPVPGIIELGDGFYELEEDFRVAVQGVDDERVYRAATRMLRRLSNRTGLFFPQDFLTPESPKEGDMMITVERVADVELGMDESYVLEVSQDDVTLSAETDVGALRGMETFLQLLTVNDGAYVFPLIRVQDEPRFPWRGLLIDVCRHWEPVAVIKRNLDAMAAMKLNVLHWHLSEDQGFRVECKTFPKLHEFGSDGFYYTHEQIKDVIDYAADHGIRVMPEFDIPGHSTSWFVGYSELASQPGPYTIERHFGIMDPTFNPTIEETYTFFDAFFREMSALFPDEYMHIGGDENSGVQWDANEQVQEFMREHDIESNHELQSYFNQRILKILTKYDKKMVGWDEILQPDMPTNIVIQSWRGKEALYEAAKKGYQSMLSNGYYIDLIRPTDHHYLNDPLPKDVPVNEEQAERILGGEATMWGEFVTPETIDSRIWPRLAAIAERFWSPREINDVRDMYRRLEAISYRLEEHGLTHKKNVPMMLRRLTNNHEISSLRTLVEIIEPLKGYQRPAQREYTTYSPLTRVVDAARPDAKVAREFRWTVDAFLAGEGQSDSLRKVLLGQLTVWRDNHDKLAKIIAVSPILDEISSLSWDLSECAAISIELVNSINSGNRLSNEKIERFSNTLKKAEKPRGQTELMILPALEQMLNYVKNM